MFASKAGAYPVREHLALFANITLSWKKSNNDKRHSPSISSETKNCFFLYDPEAFAIIVGGLLYSWQYTKLTDKRTSLLHQGTVYLSNTVIVAAL
jgi:hypothetical protein